MYILIAFFALVSCREPQNVSITKSSELKSEAVLAPDTIERQWESAERTPSIIINNIDFDENRFNLGDHLIEWIDNGDKRRIKINGNIIELEKEVTLNKVTHADVDSLNFSNNWQQARLYKYHDNGLRDLILVTMISNPCTGLGCSVEYVMIYDAHTKTANFFGSFRGNKVAELYHFGNNGLYYMSQTFDGPYHGESPVIITKNLYRMDSSGTFSIAKDAQGEPYYTKKKLYNEGSKLVEEFEMSWITQ